MNGLTRINAHRTVYRERRECSFQYYIFVLIFFFICVLIIHLSLGKIRSCVQKRIHFTDLDLFVFTHLTVSLRIALCLAHAFCRRNWWQDNVEIWANERSRTVIEAKGIKCQTGVVMYKEYGNRKKGYREGGPVYAKRVARNINHGTILTINNSRTHR